MIVSDSESEYIPVRKMCYLNKKILNARSMWKHKIVENQ